MVVDITPDLGAKSMTDLSTVRQFLICIARRAMDEQVGARVRSLAHGEVDWDCLVREATDHGLLPLLHTHLNATCRDLVPSSILARLKEESLANSQCNLYLMRELIRTLDLLRANSIEALAFKGPVLGAMLYGDLSLRQAGDLDILIHKEDFCRAKRLLESAGYRMEPQLSKSQQSSHLNFHCEIQFVHHEQISVVDLHWGLTPKAFPFSLNAHDLFARSVALTFAGHTIQTFSREDLLLYLCMNGAKDNWNQLESVALVAELLRFYDQLDWTSCIKRAGASRSRNMLALGLVLAKDLFKCDIPAEVLAALNGHESLHQTALIIERRLLGEARMPPTQMQQFRMNLRYMDRKRDAVLGLARAIYVPTISDWQTVSLPGPLYPLYYLLRPVRLIRKYQVQNRER
ncbi:MAG TPA: nucleotidyltransferase family protein [Pyrinomonadaceae bacterium]|nr:nucleotidyltransferase family protein [Pyrinomonadaceae bacterium]